MRRPMVAALVAAAAASTLVAIPLATSADASGGTAASRVHTVRLTGAQEVPGPGDPDGFGTFRYRVSHWRLCYTLSVHRIGRPMAAHIHFGQKGKAGPIVVTLNTPTKGFSSGCIKAVRHQNSGNAALVLTRRELSGIVRFPSLYYTNAHNKKYPNGAIRGQLGRHGSSHTPTPMPTPTPTYTY